MSRVCLLILDSLGIGAAPDAAVYGDAGADTLGHIADACSGGLEREGRSGSLYVPCLSSLGLGLAAELASGRIPSGLHPGRGQLIGVYACAAEVSLGKDTPSGHFEMLGAPVRQPWGYFAADPFPIAQELLCDLVDQTHLPGVLGNCRESGTDILRRLGEEHLRSGKPIVYTSVDSVLQIAAHEVSFGLERLYAICRIARGLVDPLHIARVIARPFIGDSAQTFRRTGNRKDFSSPPPASTVLDCLVQQGGAVWAVGKVGDIFAHRSVTREIRGSGIPELMDRTISAWRELPDNALLLSNIVDFDSVYGHRRDVPGYAAALEYLDSRLPALLALVGPGDLLIITADHGCDPTWFGTDHTREQVPVLLYSPEIGSGCAGRRCSFADTGATIADFLGISGTTEGQTLMNSYNRYDR